MTESRNKKRFFAIFMVFVIVFTAGAAFASHTGNLDIGGDIGLTPPELDVAFHNVSATATGEAAVNQTESLGTPGTGLYNQSLNFDIDFTGPGSVTLQFDIVNFNNRRATLTVMPVSTISPLDLDLHGLTVNGGTTWPVFPTTLGPATGSSTATPVIGGYETITMVIAWDGSTVPATWDPNTDSLSFSWTLNWRF